MTPSGGLAVSTAARSRPVAASTVFISPASPTGRAQPAAGPTGGRPAGESRLAGRAAGRPPRAAAAGGPGREVAARGAGDGLPARVDRAGEHRQDERVRLGARSRTRTLVGFGYDSVRRDGHQALSAKGLTDSTVRVTGLYLLAGEPGAVS